MNRKTGSGITVSASETSTKDAEEGTPRHLTRRALIYRHCLPPVIIVGLLCGAAVMLMFASGLQSKDRSKLRNATMPFIQVSTVAPPTSTTLVEKLSPAVVKTPPAYLDIGRYLQTIRIPCGYGNWFPLGDKCFHFSLEPIPASESTAYCGTKDSLPQYHGDDDDDLFQHFVNHEMARILGCCFVTKTPGIGDAIDYYIAIDAFVNEALNLLPGSLSWSMEAKYEYFNPITMGTKAPTTMRSIDSEMSSNNPVTSMPVVTEPSEYLVDDPPLTRDSENASSTVLPPLLTTWPTSEPVNPEEIIYSFCKDIVKLKDEAWEGTSCSKDFIQVCVRPLP